MLTYTKIGTYCVLVIYWFVISAEKAYKNNGQFLLLIMYLQMFWRHKITNFMQEESN